MSKGSGNANTAAVLSIIPKMTEREQFLAVLQGGPIMPPDAVVLLAGEDWKPRLDRAVGRFAELKRFGLVKRVEWYKPVIVATGGLHDPPHLYGAKQIVPKIVGMGVSHNRVRFDDQSRNTREQAENIIAMTEEEGWKRLMLVASPYHMPRAFLTFLKVLQERDLTEVVELLTDSADQTPWFDCPDGSDQRRVDLLASELQKIERYADHVATYADGLKYLEWWESHVPEMGSAA